MILVISKVGNHRRTESCHLDSRAPVVRCPAERSNQTNYLLRNSLPAAPILAGTSPIPMQKNLAVQSSLKCIECKFYSITFTQETFYCSYSVMHTVENLYLENPSVWIFVTFLT